ncbi:MAG TPA: hypothetical protein VF796_21890 [Humisphaera sp.]
MSQPSSPARGPAPRRRPSVAAAAAARANTPPVPVALEAVEGRQLFSVALTAGYTLVTPAVDDRVVYVSSSAGNDANTGLSATAPVKTIARAKSLVRSGYGDQLLLKRGDTWHEAIGTWTKSGRGADDPMVIGAYGTGARPTLATGSATGLVTGSTSYPTVDHLVVQGVRFYADARDPSSATYVGAAGSEGVRLLAASTDTLLEDVEVDGYTTNVTVDTYFGAISNVRVRRCVIADSYNTAGHSQGLYANGVKGLTLTENVLDHNGWNAAVSGAQQTIYNHDAYIKESVTGFVARGNLFANASSHGMQARAGGVIENNTFLNNPIGLSFGHVNGSPVTAGGVSGRVANNLFIGGRSIDASARGWGIEAGNIRAGGATAFTGNVFADAPVGSGYAIYLTVGSNVTNPDQAVGINDLSIDHNVVYGWSKGLYINDSLVPGGTGQYALNRVTIANNDFQRLQSQYALHVGTNFSASQVFLSGNRYDTAAAGGVMVGVGSSTSVAWSSWAAGRETGSAEVRVSYLDAARSAGTYVTSLSLGSTDADYVTVARKLSSATFRADLLGSALATYVRTGFGVGTTTTTGGTTTTSGGTTTTSGGTTTTTGGTTTTSGGTTTTTGGTTTTTGGTTTSGGTTTTTGGTTTTTGGTTTTTDQPPTRKKHGRWA